MWLSSATPLARVRWAFLALGGSLVLLILGLLHSALARLDEQRGLRHRMVAERVFDEVEREIGAVLQHEAERPSRAYDAEETDPRNWSPFVLGYYRRDPGLQLIAARRLDAARIRRIDEAATRAWPLVAAEETERFVADGGKTAEPSGASSPDILRQLNRGVKVRERRMHDFLSSFGVGHVGPLLVAERTTRDGSRREGVVVDVPILVRTIEAWVLGSQGLRSLASLAMTPPLRPSSYTFRHRLAAPFEMYEISLSLAQLDDEDAASTLFGFAALFALAAVLGLFAICRMVEVQIAFAERRNNFVAAVTHELRTPLTSIRMYGEMLRDGMVQDEATRREYYTTITAEGERLTRLINNVMEHARLRRGQRHAQLQRGDAGTVVREVVELMRPHIEREGFSVALAVSPDLPGVRLDSDALKQMLFNVIDNALKYGRNGEAAQIDVSCNLAADGGVLVCVRDYGPGVPESQLTAVFEPFLRGENELTRRQQGTGLGLSLVRDLSGLMKGDVRAVNRGPGLELQILLRAA